MKVPETECRSWQSTDYLSCMFIAKWCELVRNPGKLYLEKYQNEIFRNASGERWNACASLKLVFQSSSPLIPRHLANKMANRFAERKPGEYARSYVNIRGECSFLSRHETTKTPAFSPAGSVAKWSMNCRPRESKAFWTIPVRTNVDSLVGVNSFRANDLTPK